MTETIELMRAYADVMLTLVGAVGVLYIVFILNRIVRGFERNSQLTQAIKEREFHSRYSDERLDIERQIGDLNLQLARSKKQFEDINHLLLSGQQKPFGTSDGAIDSTPFLKSLSLDSSKIKIDKNLVFVLTPFHPSEERTYSAIVEGLSKFGVRVLRGDEMQGQGDILSGILAQMTQARIVIANVSTRNPNVMYELGIAHALGKDVIMIANNGSELPFDVNSRRIVFYKDHSDLVSKLSGEIARRVFESS